ncbi:MAG: GNAT family N-acetyltransferase, partial [Candidatus Bathyarchaeia archaeon]
GFYRMTANLDAELPLPPVPEGVTVRCLKAGEEEELVKAVNAGFGWERLKMGSIQFWKTENPPFDESWVQVAVADNKIVSAVVARPDTHYNEFFNKRRAHLGPATTLPEYRRKNLATILTIEAMNFLFRKGFTSVALGVAEQNIASFTLLKKIGFEVRHHWKILSKNLTKNC